MMDAEERVCEPMPARFPFARFEGYTVQMLKTVLYQTPSTCFVLTNKSNANAGPNANANALIPMLYVVKENGYHRKNVSQSSSLLGKENSQVRG
jgi:hypothetical protein